MLTRKNGLSKARRRRRYWLWNGEGFETLDVHSNSGGASPGSDPSVIFDAVALVLSENGCAALLNDGAALDFAMDAFGHLKAIGFSAEAKPLLDKAGIAPDAGVVKLDNKAAPFVEPARTRQWDRESKVRLLA